NAMKDRLYCAAPDAPGRRRCQTVMYRMLTAIVKLLSPMAVFTADEAWEYIQHKPDADRDLPSVHLAKAPEPSGRSPSTEQRQQWEQLSALRDAALLQLDALKKQVGLNKASEGEVVYHVDAATKKQLEAYGVDLEDMVGAGYHTLLEASGEARVEVIDR